MQIIPIASGKGGVGKSLVSANLAIALAQAGKKVLLADLDLGGSNLHMVLGEDGNRTGIGAFLNNNKIELKEIIYPTGIKNLSFLPGESELPDAANYKTGTKRRLVNRLLNLEADYLIIDLGAGTHQNIMDLFLLSGQGIVVTTPTLTATLNAYLFLKNIQFRILTTSFRRGSPAATYIETLKKDGVSLQKVYVPQLINNIRKIDESAWKEYTQRIAHFHPKLILNMLEDPKESTKANRLRHSCKEYLGLELEHLGILYRDDQQTRALNSRLPIIQYKPESVLSQGIYRICDKILDMENPDTTTLSPLDPENSFQVAALEAEADFNSKISALEELLHSGALTQGDLIDTIKNQQYEINQLKKESRFLKSKLIKATQAGFKL